MSAFTTVLPTDTFNAQTHNQIHYPTFFVLAENVTQNYTQSYPGESPHSFLKILLIFYLILLTLVKIVPLLLLLLTLVKVFLGTCLEENDIGESVEITIDSDSDSTAEGV